MDNQEAFERPDTRPNYGLYVYEGEYHRGATWHRGIDAALPAFTEMAKANDRVMLVNVGDHAIAEQQEHKLLYASHSLIQAVPSRNALLAPLQRALRTCAFCRKEFLPSRQPGKGDLWECEQHLSPCCSDACWETTLKPRCTERVKVEMHAFGDGAIREVKVPFKEWKKAADEKKKLELVFYWGQNDFQEQQLPSVSMHDVVVLDGRRFRVMAQGFEEVKSDGHEVHPASAP